MESSITQALNSFQNQLADIEIEKEMGKYRKERDSEVKPTRPFETIINKEINDNSTIESEKSKSKPKLDK